MRETLQLPAIDPDSTEKRQAITAASLLARLIQQQQDELAQAQRNIEAMLQAWRMPVREE